MLKIAIVTGSTRPESVTLDTQYPVAGRLCADTRLFTSATFCNASVKERFGLFSHALQLLFELSQFVTRKSCKHFLHRLDVRAENWRDDGFSAGGQSNDTNPAVLGAFGTAHQAFGDKSVDCHADRSRCQIDFRTDHIDG